MPFPKDRRREQRQSYILRQLGPELRELFQDESKLASLYVTRVELSPEGTVCTIFFSTFTQAADFEEAKETLELYKPSVRRSLSKILHGRHTPFVRFRYDVGQEKARHMQSLFDQIEHEKGTPPTPDPDDE